MSLPKTLSRARERLESVGSLQLHAEEIIGSLTEDREYRGLYEGKVVSSTVDEVDGPSMPESSFSDMNRTLKRL